MFSFLVVFTCTGTSAAKGNMKTKAMRATLTSTAFYLVMLKSRERCMTAMTLVQSGKSISMHEICHVHRCDFHCCDVVHLACKHRFVSGTSILYDTSGPDIDAYKCRVYTSSAGSFLVIVSCAEAQTCTRKSAGAESMTRLEPTRAHQQEASWADNISRV